jgi:hypothetical protein
MAIALVTVVKSARAYIRLHVPSGTEPRTGGMALASGNSSESTRSLLPLAAKSAMLSSWMTAFAIGAETQDLTGGVIRADEWSRVEESHSAAAKMRIEDCPPNTPAPEPLHSRRPHG